MNEETPIFVNNELNVLVVYLDRRFNVIEATLAEHTRILAEHEEKLTMIMEIIAQILETIQKHHEFMAQTRRDHIALEYRVAALEA